MIIGQELSETVGLYILAFIFVGILTFYRNYLFQVFNKSALKNSFISFNRALLVNYNFFFFNIFKKIKIISFSSILRLKKKLKK
jgi:hypothetical protein